MASVREDWTGLIIELDHAETEDLLAILTVAGDVTPRLSGFLGLIGVGAAVVPVIAAAILVHLAWEIPAIKRMDEGNGVILTMPWLTPGVLIPATRYPRDVNQNWAAIGSGTFVVQSGDRVDYHVDRGVGDPATVVFRIVNVSPKGWDKGFTLRDGLGNEWPVRAGHAGANENSLWAEQTQNGQLITFAKPGFLAVWRDVFSVGGLAALKGGDRATFTWLTD
ncbi:MAG TPA: hypothetical protein VF800_21695 [Telluria sp.]|jgi:hypothetical protein